MRELLPVARPRNSVVFTDAAGNITHVNAAFRAITGYNDEIALGAPFVGLLASPSSDAATRKSVLKTIREAESYSDEICIRRADGESLWVRCSLDPIDDTGGGMVAVLSDISESRELRQRLARNERRMRELLENVSEVIFERMVGGGWTYLNPAWEAITGYTVEEMLDQPDIMVVVAEDRERLFQRMEATRIGEWIADRVRLVRKDGEVRIVDGQITRRVNDFGTEVFFGTFSDVTQRIEHLRELQRERSLTNTVINSAGSLIVVMDREGRIQHFNPYCERVTGYTEAELLGTIPVMLLPEEERENFQERIADLRIQDFPNSYEAVWIHRDGSQRQIRWTHGAVATDTGEIETIVAVGQDVTQQRMVEAMLEESRWRCEAYISGVNEGLFEINPEGVLVYLSDRCYELLGYSPSGFDPTRDLIMELLHPDDVGATHQIWDDLLAGRRQSNEREVRFWHKTLGYRWYLVRTVCSQRPNGQPTGFIGSVTDIDARRSAEQDLLRTRDLLMESQRVARLGSWEIDVQTDSITYTPQTLEVLGLEPEIGSLTLTLFVSRLVPADRVRMLREYRLAVREQSRREFEVRFDHGEGSAGYLRVAAMPILDGDGRVTRIVGSVQDVTENRLAEVEIARQRAFLRKVIDISPNYIFVKDQQHRYVLGNEAVANHYGVTPDQLIGKKNFELCSDPEEAKVLASTEETLRNLNEDRVAFEERVTSVRGEVRTIYTVQTPIQGMREGENWILGVCTDITERAQMQREIEAAREAALESSRLKSEFLANMSHEIRTPMNGVLGMANLLLETPLNADQSELALTLRQSGESLLEILNDILDFSKIEAGKLEVARQEFDAADLVEEVAALFSPRAEEKGLRLRAEIDWSNSYFLQSDPLRIRQILSNLTNNAVKFTERGEVVLHLSQKDDGVVQFSVSDTGVGIPPSRQQSIFQSFVQVDGSSSRRHGGTGLGLSIAQQLTGLLGGTISVDSAEGLGSTFTVEIPGSRWAGESASSVRGTTFDVRTNSAEEARRITAMLVSLGMRPDAREPQVIVAETVSDDPGHWIALVERGQAIPETAHGYVIRPLLRRSLERAILAANRHGLVVATGSGIAAQRSMRILVAEDNLVNQKVVLRMLRPYPHHVETVVCGDDALSRAVHEPFDLILMDVQMPGMDGLEATRRIRSWEMENGRRTPIIALTAHAMQGDRERCLAAGMDDYIRKPIQKEELLEKIERWSGMEAEAMTEFDMTYLCDIAGDDLEFRRDVIETYVHAMEPLLSQMRAAAAQLDTATVYRVAHTLKGSSRSVGANAFAHVCELAEGMAREGRLAEAVQMVELRAEQVLQEARSIAA